MAYQSFTYPGSILLESGVELQQPVLAYHTFGALNARKDNVVWICHALTANSDVLDWWSGLLGPGKPMDPSRHFIVCANILGSCYGSSGPLSTNPATGAPYYADFPQITIRDMVMAHQLLREHLGIDRIHILAGGSMGGYQVLEWALAEPERMQHLFLLATGAAESAWGIAIHTAQRLAIEADSSWRDPKPDAGRLGLKAARAIGMLTYRNYRTFVDRQTDTDIQKTDGFKASSYIEYQGDKLVQRFNAQSYWLLTKAMDSHNIARGRATRTDEVLRSLQARSLIIGITSDILCPVEEQRYLAQNMPASAYYEIDSLYGHDGFLIEFERIGKIFSEWIQQRG